MGSVDSISANMIEQKKSCDKCALLFRVKYSREKHDAKIFFFLLVKFYCKMPRESNADEEAERKARTPYDILRYRLEKLQENPVSWFLVIYNICLI
jgi:hypothetical protein